MITKNSALENNRLTEKSLGGLTPEMETLKARLKATWMAGRFPSRPGTVMGST